MSKIKNDIVNRKKKVDKELINKSKHCFTEPSKDEIIETNKSNNLIQSLVAKFFDANNWFKGIKHLALEYTEGIPKKYGKERNKYQQKRHNKNVISNKSRKGKRKGGSVCYIIAKANKFRKDECKIGKKRKARIIKLIKANKYNGKYFSRFVNEARCI